MKPRSPIPIGGEMTRSMCPTKMSWIAPWVLAGMAAGAGCSSTNGLSQCVPNEVVSCPCAGGARGTQTCRADSTYGACACPAADAGAMDVVAKDAGATIRPDVPDAISVDAPDVVAMDAPIGDAATVSDLPDIAAPPDVAPDMGCGDAARCDESCVDLRTDPRNCGRCGHDCARLTGVAGERVACVDGVCDVRGACQPGRAHCTARADDGCETALDSATNCGACGVACREPAPFCSAGDGGVGACVSGCGAAARCGMSCVDTATSVANCGACGRRCPDVAGATATCVDGACGFACDRGFHRCGERCVSDAAVESCGGRCAPCPAGPNSSAACSTNMCALRCDAGFADCDGDPANGCEVDTRTSASHCGACRAACAAPQNGTARCVDGRCASSCATGYHDCAGRCAPNSAAESCGDRCSPCPVGPNATATCDGSRCGVSCESGYADCDGDPANGCEVDTRSDTSHCGACRAACSAPANASATCAASACGFTCYAGFSRSGSACVAPRGTCPARDGALMVTVLREEFDGTTLNPALFQSTGSLSIAGGVLSISSSAPSGITTIQFSAPAIVEVRGILPQTAISYNHFAISRCGGYAPPCPLEFWSFSSHWENRSAQVQVEYYTPAFQREHYDTAFDSRTLHTYRFVLGERSQQNYIDGTLVREYALQVPAGTAWTFSAGTWYSNTNAQIDSITIQAQAVCGFCPPS